MSELSEHDNKRGALYDMYNVVVYIHTHAHVYACVHVYTAYNELGKFTQKVLTGWL